MYQCLILVPEPCCLELTEKNEKFNEKMERKCENYSEMEHIYID